MLKLKEKEVLSIIEKALQIKSGTIKISSSSKNIEQWDSLGHLNILLSLDKKLKGKTAKFSELADAHSISKIINVLKKNKFIQ
jgi:acyl carrier protein